MARKKNPKPVSEDLLPEEAEWEETAEVPEADAEDPALARQRDWRDLEKYFEERDLKRRLKDEFWVGEDRPKRPPPGARRKR
ncbi:MAG: hypothetical protein ACRETN_09125 [Nevskiales bacterium]